MRLRPLLIAGAGLIVIAGVVAVALLSGDPLPPLPTPGPQEQIGIQWLKAPGTEAAYAGDQACRECHVKEFRSHAETPHARTLRRLAPGEHRAEFADRNGVEDGVHRLMYTVQNDGGKPWVVVYDGAKAQRGSPGWAFGSGTHAWTYVSRGPAGFVEYRISYYPQTREWNFTPGQGPNDPLPFTLGQASTNLGAAACFGCHSTVLVGTPEALDLDRSRLNIGCESCHGPGRAHAESATAGSGATLVRLKPPSGAAQTAMCTACHRSAMTLSPNEHGVEKQLARFSGTALMRSRCYTESAGKLTCTTCHNPHQQAASSPRAYDAACGSCHTAPATTCAQGKRSDCVTCHMPEQSIARKLPLAFHNHWIRARIPESEQRETALPADRRPEGNAP